MPLDEVVIVPYQDGPYLVRGPVRVRDQRGNEIALSRQPIALCRCGKSRTRPFCDGTHRNVHFTAPSELEQAATSGVQTHGQAQRARPSGNGTAPAARPERSAAELLGALRTIEHSLRDRSVVAMYADGEPRALRAVAVLREAAALLEALR